MTLTASFGSFEHGGYKPRGIRTFRQKKFTKVLWTKHGEHASSTFRILTATACVLHRSLRRSPERVSPPVFVAGRIRRHGLKISRCNLSSVPLRPRTPLP